MKTINSIYIESSCLLEGVSGIARWVEVISSSLNLSGYNVISVNKKMFGFGDNLVYDILYYNVFLPIYLRLKGGGSAILFVPNNMSKFLFRPLKNTVYFMHDLIPLDSKCGYRGLRKQIYLLKLSQIRNALAIFTTTLYVKEQIDNVIRGSVQVYPVFGFINESFVHGKGEWSRDIKLPSKFIVAVGTGECRKNIDSILEVYAYDIDHHKLPHLVLFGKSWGALGHKYIYKKAKSLNVADKILLVGAVTDEELCYLYNQCSIFVYPSLSEGFGLPPIEALACGAKVIVSDLPVFRETLKRNVKYVDPDDALGFHNAIVKTMRQSVVIPSRLLEQYSRKNAKRNVLLFMCNIVNELG